MAIRSSGRGRGSLEIDSRDVKARAVARTFEFAFAFQPVRRAAEVRANGLQGVDQVFAVVVVVDQPHAVLAVHFVATLAGG